MSSHSEVFTQGRRVRRVPALFVLKTSFSQPSSREFLSLNVFQERGTLALVRVAQGKCILSSHSEVFIQGRRVRLIFLEDVLLSTFVSVVLSLNDCSALQGRAPLELVSVAQGKGSYLRLIDFCINQLQARK